MKNSVLYYPIPNSADLYLPDYSVHHQYIHLPFQERYLKYLPLSAPGSECHKPLAAAGSSHHHILVNVCECHNFAVLLSSGHSQSHDSPF